MQPDPMPLLAVIIKIDKFKFHCFTVVLKFDIMELPIKIKLVESKNWDLEEK